MNKEEIKDNIVFMLQTHTLTDEELEFVFDILFYTYTQDYDLLEMKVKEFIGKSE